MTGGSLSRGIGSLSRGVGSLSRELGLCPGELGLCPGELGLCLGRGVSVQGGGSLSRGVGSLSRGVGSLSRGWGLCPGGSMPRRGSLSRGSLSGSYLSGRSPSMVMSGRYASYWNAFLFKLRNRNYRGNLFADFFFFRCNGLSYLLHA